MKIKLLVLLSLTVTLFTPIFSSPPVSLATRGCCSWHGGVSHCDSSAGQYVCNDGTYSPSCGCVYSPQVYTPPVYVQPTATPTPIPLELNVRATYELNPSTCTYTIRANWDEPLSYDQYSVSAVKTTSQECQNPGPIADTSETEYLFPGLRSGSYLVNVRPKNSLEWNYYTYCNTVQLPPVKPLLTVETVKEEGQQYISYTSSCATSIKANNGIGYINTRQGKFKVNPKGEVTYTLTAVSGEGETEEKSIMVTDATPTQVPAVIIPTEEPQKSENIFIRIFRFLIGEN